MKKWFALLLVLVLCVPSVMVYSEESEPKKLKSGDWEYILLEDGTADITNYSNNNATSVEIPKELDGHPVTISGMNPFWLCDAISSFTVSSDHPTFATIDGVLFNKTEKKLVAFPNASTLTEYAIPEGILSVGELAFWCCTSLTTIMLPKSVTSINAGAFAAYPALTDIYVSPENPAFTVVDGVLFDKAEKTLVAFPSGVARTKYVVPDGVVSIASWAFFGCESLTEIVLPDNVTSIGPFAFFQCCGLPLITLPNSVTSIGRGAFVSCKSLTNITIPESVISIGDSLFSYCDSLQNVRVAPNSYAEQYCKDNKLPIAYIENTDWLTN